jgi:hypothetical protein
MQTMERRVVATIRRLLLFALLPGAAVAAAAWVKGIRYLLLPYETTRPEAFILDGVARVAAGQALYRDLQSLPFVVHVYNPLTYLPTALLAAVLGLNLHGMLITGRILSFSCALLLALLLARWTRRETSSRVLGLLAFAGIFFFHEVLVSEFYRLRPECPALLLTFSGVLLLLSSHRYGAVLSAVLFFGAFCFKQTFVAAPLSAWICLLVGRRFKDALRFTGTGIALLCLFYGIMWLWSRGAHYENTTLSMAVNDVRPLAAFRDYAPRLWAKAWSLILATPLAVALLIHERRYRFLMLYLGVLSVWTFISSGKYGASWNYFAELGVLSLWIVVLALRSEQSRRAFAQLPLIAVLAAHAWMSALGGTLSRDLHERPVFDLDPYVERFRSAGAFLTTNERLAVHVGDPEVLDWILIDHLAQKGIIDPTPLFERIATGYYDSIALERRTTTSLEEYLFRVVADGPYERIDVREGWMRMYVFARIDRGPR